MPRLIVHRPHDDVAEPDVVWWHVNIIIEKRWWSSIEALHNCRVYMVIGDWRAQLTWRNGIEVTETVTLQSGESWCFVPVIVRKDSLGDVGLSASPGRLPRFPVNAFEPRVTDIEAVFHNRNLQTLPLGDHVVTIEVHSGRDVLTGSPLYLYIPNPNEGNRRFIFR